MAFRESSSEVNKVGDIFRRIAAVLLPESARDENYNSVEQNAYHRPASARTGDRVRAPSRLRYLPTPVRARPT